MSENFGTVHAVALEYVPALYPLLLVFITFLVIRMYDHNVYPVVWIWRRFNLHKMCLRLRKTWDIKRSIINSFSTFLFLSYSRMVLISLDLLYVVPIYDVNGTVIMRSLRLDSTVTNFGPSHAPFAFLAIFTIIICGIFLILLLVFYPTRLFQKCLQRFCYNGYLHRSFRPYKEDYMNYCELCAFFLLGIAGFMAYLWLFSRMPSQFFAYVFVLTGLLPQLVLTCYIAYLLF